MGVFSVRNHNNYISAEIPTEFSKYKQEKSLVNGRMVNKSVFVYVNPSVEDKDFTVFDFSLDSLIAVGAVNKLQTVSFSGDVKIDDLVSSVTALKNSISENEK